MNKDKSGEQYLLQNNPLAIYKVISGCLQKLSNTSCFPESVYLQLIYKVNCHCLKSQLRFNNLEYLNMVIILYAILQNILSFLILIAPCFYFQNSLIMILMIETMLAKFTVNFIDMLYINAEKQELQVSSNKYFDLFI